MAWGFPSWVPLSRLEVYNYAQQFAKVKLLNRPQNESFSLPKEWEDLREAFGVDRRFFSRASNYQKAFEGCFSKMYEPSHVLGQWNHCRYLPSKKVLWRLEEGIACLMPSAVFLPFL